KWPEAIDAYKLAIRVDPNHAPAHGGLGYAYLNTGNPEPAHAAFKEQVRLAPSDAGAHFDLGYYYNFMGRHGEAFAPLVRATSLDPAFAEAFYEIGFAYLRGTDFEKSIPFFRSAIRLNPDYAEAYYSLGQTYAQLGKGDLAQAQLVKLKTVAPRLALKLESEIPTTLANAEAEKAMLDRARASASAETPPAPVSGTAPPASANQSTAAPPNRETLNPSPPEPFVTRDSASIKTRPRQLQASPKIESDRPTNLSGPTAQSNRIQNRPEIPRRRQQPETISPPVSSKPVGDGDWTEIIRQTMPGVVSISLYNGDGKLMSTGSGFLVASDGVVVTNYHVIQAGSAAVVTTKQGDKFEVTSVLSYDRAKDFAILKIPAFDLPTVSLGNSNNTEVGESVLAIGDPGDRSGSFPATVSAGIITAKGRELEGSTWLQTSTPVSHGNSGGPLINRRAEAVGVISRGRNIDGQNFNFAVPINFVRGGLGTASKVSLSQLARLEAEIVRAEQVAKLEAIRKLFTKYEDPGAIYSLTVIKEWRVQRGRRTLDNGMTADETVFAPQNAALAEVGGYLSEGMRVVLYFPAPGGEFTVDAIETFKNQFPELALRGNPGFEVSQTGMFIINELQAKVYTIEGKGQRLPEAERNVSYVFGSKKAIVQIDIVQPESKIALLEILSQLAKSFEFNPSFSAGAGPLVTPSGTTATSAVVTLRDLELSFQSNLFDETIRNARRFLQTNPNSPQAHGYLGYSLLVKKDVDNAVDHLLQTIVFGETVMLHVKRLREPLLGHGLDEGTITFTRDSIIIRTGSSIHEANFSAIMESRLGNYNNTCPIVFLKGIFLDTANRKGKPGEKGFNLFPPSAGLRAVQQGQLVYNVAVCNDDGTVPNAAVKLLYRLKARAQ
ncbi:MAG: trypsin-like peptidase domain-containing protein, partial [Pyrinomonadaceae bacterium]